MLDRQEAVNGFSDNKAVDHGHKDGVLSQQSSHTRVLFLQISRHAHEILRE